MNNKTGIVLLFILSVALTSCNHSVIKTATVTTHSMTNHFGEPQVDTTLACDRRVYEYDQTGKIIKQTVFWGDNVFYMYKFSYNEDNIVANYYENNSGKLVNRYTINKDNEGFIESIYVDYVARGEKAHKMDESEIDMFLRPEWDSYCWSVIPEDTNEYKYTYDSKTGLLTSYSYYVNYEVREMTTIQYEFW